MFVGHLAVALGTKEAQPKIPLAALVAASFGIDLIWPVLLFARVEVVRVAPGDTAFTPLAFVYYPWSHSLAMVLLWSVVAAIAAAAFLKSARAAIVIGAVVTSHWLLDLITHRPDLPLWPGSARFGVGMWNTIPGTLILEGAMFVAAIALFARAFRPRWSFWALVLLTGAIWASQPWSPPPPNAKAVASVAMVMWILPLWAWWIERRLPARRD